MTSAALPAMTAVAIGVPLSHSYASVQALLLGISGPDFLTDGAEGVVFFIVAFGAKVGSDVGVDVLEWLPYSPDLNPIEHLWFQLKQLVYQVNPKIEQVKGDIDTVRGALWDALDGGQQSGDGRKFIIAGVKQIVNYRILVSLKVSDDGRCQHCLPGSWTPIEPQQRWRM